MEYLAIGLAVFSVAAGVVLLIVFLDGKIDR